MGVHTTLTDIANEALVSMRKEPISNIEEAVGTQATRTMKTTASILWLVIHDVIRCEQKRFHWQELEVTIPLVKLSDPDPDNYEGYFKYAYPADLISPIQLFSGVAWHRKNNFLYTRDANAVFNYTRFNFDDIASWSDDLFNCCWSGLAARTAGRLTQDSGIKQEAKQEWMFYRAEAGMLAGRDRESQLERGSDFNLVQSTLWQRSGGLNPTDNFRTSDTPHRLPFRGASNG